MNINNKDLLLSIKNNIERINKKFEPEDFLEIILEISKMDKEFINGLYDILFVYNNNFYKKYRNFEINQESYNLGMYDLFNIIVNHQLELCNKIEYEKEIKLLKEKQKLILNIIYENDGIDSNSIKKMLNISSQYLYNLTNDSRFLKLVIINKNYKTKKVFYSLNYECRKALDQTIEKNNYYDLVINQKFKVLENKKIYYKEDHDEFRRSRFKYNS